MTYIEIQNEVIKRYRVKIDTYSLCRQRMHAHVKERRVCKWKQVNSVQATFDLLHEVGHIETTKSWMRRAEEEYHATVWAIERCREFGIRIPLKVWERYQNYINREADRGYRRGGKGYGNLDLPQDVIG